MIIEMKWESGVTIEKRKDTYIFLKDKKEKEAEMADAYIIQAIECGSTDDDELVELVMETEKENEIIARLRLAQFVLDYGDYISNDVGHMMIEP